MFLRSNTTKHMTSENWMTKVKTYSRKIFIVLFEWMVSMALGLVNIFFQRTDHIEMEKITVNEQKESWFRTTVKTAITFVG